MSLKTWKADFYPVSANSELITDEIDAVKHALQKWYGLRAENLAKHGMIDGYDYIYDIETGERFYINGKSCALCEFNTYCGSCILSEHLGQRCDEPLMPYEVWLDIGDPQPMTLVLEEIIKEYEG